MAGTVTVVVDVALAAVVTLVEASMIVVLLGSVTSDVVVEVSEEVVAVVIVVGVLLGVDLSRGLGEAVVVQLLSQGTVGGLRCDEGGTVDGVSDVKLATDTRASLEEKRQTESEKGGGRECG